MPEQNDTVILEIKENIAVIILNRPRVMNAFNDELVKMFYSILKKIANDSSIRAVVITGAGKAFSAGGDLNYLSSLGPVEAREFIKSVGDIVRKIMTMEKPVVAMVNGVAAGAGFNLALACDIVFCADSARFGQSFAKVGLIPDCGGLYLLPRAVSIYKAKELMFTGKLIEAEEALHLGIVNQIIEKEKLQEFVCQFTRDLAEGSPLALSITKSMLNRSGEMTLDDVLENENAQQTVCMQTEDFREGTAAFREKRKPVFKGR
ncbi:enoyl-CoA hydratase/isomerase family protein [Pectinatus haikarae]|uniref:2-(1,2-epoxy-1,2-dihydrophenyl)acetyl-CoA isomerase n=1 Tax=Pectinatus haikarae TaxID=349096 RepID=A0ABT9YB69_9FIRM|nr:enoyl-CoA hydratase [Pectinatus haikarae]MDQ0205083.1 2-(1,2-epoxy-1,2-dihydrophenyl)acetyl-CoA isomerase [Pectinatus haikarae]